MVWWVTSMVQGGTLLGVPDMVGPSDRRLSDIEQR